MYFLRVQPLKEQLAREGLTEKDRFWYLMVWMILMALSSSVATQHSVSSVLLLFLITVAGVVWAWRRNGGPEGHGLFDRYFSIGFVVNLRVILVLLVLAGVVGAVPGLRETFESFGVLLGGFGGGGDGETGAGWSEKVSLLAEAWVAWSIGRHIGQVRAVAEAATVGVSPDGETPRRASAALVAPRALTRLDRVVEHVVESEIQAGTARTAARNAASKRGSRVAAARRIKAWRRDHGHR